jgi:hypothetical protein
MVHGDPDAASAFAERSRQDLHLDVHLPTYRETVVLRLDAG